MNLNEKHTILGPSSMPVLHPVTKRPTGQLESPHACHGAGCKRQAGYTVKVETPLGSRTDKLCKNCVDPSAFGAKKEKTVSVVHHNKSGETSRGGKTIKQPNGADTFDVSKGNKAIKYRELSRLSARGHNDRFSGPSNKPSSTRSTTNFSNPTQGNRGLPGSGGNASGVSLKKKVMSSIDVASGLNVIVEFLKANASPVFETSLNKELNPMFKDDVRVDEVAVEKTANELIKEATLFTPGPDNKFKGDTNFNGFDTKSMLSAEWFGSPAFANQAPKNSGMFADVNKITDGQATDGEGAKRSKSPEMIEAKTAIVNELVENLLEGTPAYLYNPDSVGYLLNELHECGYESFANIIEGILENPKKSDVVTLDGISEELKATKESAFLVEGVKALAVMLFETGSDQNTSPAEEASPDVQKDDEDTLKPAEG